MKDWQLQSRRMVFEADNYLKVSRDSVLLPSGQVVDDFYRIDLRSYVVCVPVLSNGDVMMLRQYKHGLGEASLTFPSGHREDGEKASFACERELLEETGHGFEELLPLAEFVDHGNQHVARGSYFAAIGCVYSQPAISGDLEEMELVHLAPEAVDRALMEQAIGLVHHALAWSLFRFHQQVNAL